MSVKEQQLETASKNALKKVIKYLADFNTMNYLWVSQFSGLFSLTCALQIKFVRIPIHTAERKSLENLAGDYLSSHVLTKFPRWTIN